MTYHTLWHAQASLVFPTATIHTIVGTSRKICNNMKFLNPRVRQLMPAGIALASIPFLIHPLDHLADITMHNTYCRLMDWHPPHCPPCKKICTDCTNSCSWKEAC